MRLASRRWLLLATVLAGVVALLLAGRVSALFSSTTTNAGSSFSASSCFPATVTIASFSFTPSTITINRGCSVTWTNAATTKHTTTSDTGVWTSGQLSQNQSYTYTFATAGTYTYKCQNHQATMAGTVVVN